MNNLIPHKKPYWLFLILLILCILISPKSKKFAKGMFFSVYDEISTYDLGFSSLGNLFGGELLDFENNLIVLLKTPKIISNSLFGVDSRDEIPKLYLDIKFKNYKKLLDDRIRSLKNNSGNDFTEVKGKINFHGKKMKCKVRLKGEYSQHWRSEKKMSFRINLKGDNSILSFKSFSIHKPTARQHPFDQTFQDIQKELGNISSSHNYINLIVNGIDWGIMNIEEHMSKELLEKQFRKESLIFKLGDDKSWLYRIKNHKNIYKDYLLSDEYLNINVYKSKKYLIDSIYRKYYTYISNEILKKNSKIFDTNSFSKSLILSLIWNSTHTLYKRNSRYYFNPYDLKIYPITSDQGEFSPFVDRLPIHKPYEKVINSSDFENSYINNFEKVKISLKESQKILDKWQSYFPLDQKISTNILAENSKLYSNYNSFKKNILGLNKVDTLNKISDNQSKNLFDHISAKHYDNGEIHLYNLLNEKIQIKNICVENKLLDNILNLELEGHKNQYNHTIIKTSLNGNFDNLIEIQTEIAGFQKLFTLGYSLVKNEIRNPLSRKNNLENLRFLELTKKGTYLVKKGNWYIEEPIVLDGGLEIEKGTTLNFKENSYLIIKGELIAKGTGNEGIIFKSNKGYWKGIYVLESNKKSIIKNTSFLNLTNLSDGLLNLTGGISFYKSDVDLINVKFINNNSEDFLNIIQSNYLMDNVIFENCSSDAFDSDFSNGVISNSTFKNILGDGVDFSGSSVKIENSIFYNVKDKSVSVGEGSSIEIRSIKVENSGVGVSVKDGSEAIVVNSNFQDIKLNPLMTYTKKSFYSTPKLTSSDNIFEDINSCCLSQIDSELINNGFIIPQKYFNVDSLYQTQIMKK